MEIQKQAKAAGVDVKNCQTCHTAALPKKGEGRTSSTTPASGWSPRKTSAAPAKVDGAWLKDYPGK